MPKQVKAHDVHSAPVTLADAQRAVAALTPSLVRLLRSLPDPGAPAVGAWTASDVAAHLAHVAELDAAAVRGRGPATLDALEVPAPRTVDGVAHLTAAMLARDPLRDPAAHASRIEHAVASLLDACDEEDRVVPWLLGTELPQSAVCGHLVSEMLLHGRDVARGARLEWTIPPDLARLAIEGFYAVVLGALGTGEWPDDPRSACEIRLRGGGRFVLAVTDSGPSVRASSASVGLRMSADPATMLLAMSGRGGSRLARVLSGRVLAWGRHPIRGLRTLDRLTAP